MDKDFWKYLLEKPVVTIILIICATILGCAIVFGGVSCTKMEYEYRLKMYGPRR